MHRCLAHSRMGPPVIRVNSCPCTPSPLLLPLQDGCTPLHCGGYGGPPARPAGPAPGPPRRPGGDGQCEDAGQGWGCDCRSECTQRRGGAVGGLEGESLSPLSCGPLSRCDGGLPSRCTRHLESWIAKARSTCGSHVTSAVRPALHGSRVSRATPVVPAASTCPVPLHCTRDPLAAHLSPAGW